MGAWIEIIELPIQREALKSLLSWERGLKFVTVVVLPAPSLSLLSWERGLKFMQILDKSYLSYTVAPLVGAWIEIGMTGSGKSIVLRRSSRGSVD